jgi:hypothetical protein
VHGFWPVEDLAELADGPTTCGDVVRSRCFSTWNFSLRGSTVLMEAEGRTRSNVLSLNW